MASRKRNENEAYSGSPPVDFPIAGNTFDYVFSNPFQKESPYISNERRVPPVRDNQPVLVDEASDRTLTYGQLRGHAVALARGLQSLGLDPEAQLQHLPPTPTCPRPEIAPIVLIQLPNCPQFATALLGTWAAGLTASLASPALTSAELAWVLQCARPRVVITARSCEGTVREAMALCDGESGQKDETAATGLYAEIPLYCVNVADEPYPNSLEATSETDWRRLLETSPSMPLRSPSFASEIRAAVILWSSGTSGRSKGVLLSHHALNFTASSLWHDADFYQGQAQRWLGFVPFYHVFGLTNLLVVAICTGSTVYTMPAFKPDVMLAAIQRRKITYLHMAPPVAVLLAKSPLVEKYARRDARGRNAFSSVVGAASGGAPLGADVVKMVYERCGFRIRLGYGLTEAGGVTLQPGFGEADMRSQRDDSGQPHWGVEVMIAAGTPSPTTSTATGDISGHITQAAKAGEPGEILIRSPALLSAYLPPAGAGRRSGGAAPDTSATAAALTPDGWFRTGDVGLLRPNGALCITDRLKELIKVRGFQVAPAELEAVLCSSAAVADAGVIGVYDEAEASEWPRAYVVPAADDTVSKTGTDETRRLGALASDLRLLVEKQTARYKWLRGGVVFVDKIPKSPSGKILRRVLRDGGVKGVEVALYEPKSRAAKL